MSSIARRPELGKIKYTVLIVDDNATNLKVISDYLKNFGFSIMVARSGEIALKRVQYALPDIILLDIMMPGINGFETCEKLKADQHTQDIPVIFMTALADAEDKVKGFEAGAVDYVTKPLQYSEVLARVTTHLKIREMARSLQDQNERLQHLTDELQKTNVALIEVSDELRDANAALSHRAVQLQASNQVGQQVTSILDLGELLTEVTELIRAKFDYYFVGVWLLYEPNERLVLQACTGGESQLLEQEHFLNLNSDENIITHVCQTGVAYLADDVNKDDLYLFLVELPQGCSQLALPLRIGDEIIGVLDIQSERPAAFKDDDQQVLQTLANQIAVAIRNVRLYEMERKINADKDKFFSIMSHDLRGPFTSLLGNAQLMLATADELCADDVRHMSSAILNGAKSALNLLDNLLTWSRMQRGAIDFFPQHLFLKEVAHKTVELLGQMAADKNIDLENTIKADMIAFADKNMVDTIIRNLTSNALKFTPRGGRVTILAQPFNSANGKSTDLIQISVVDTGVGMQPDDMEKLFRLDTNHSTPGTEKEQGTGLGLIICKEMVERNGGQIWMESEAGQGAKVRFTLPVQEI